MIEDNIIDCKGHVGIKLLHGNLDKLIIHGNTIVDCTCYKRKKMTFMEKIRYVIKFWRNN